MRGLRLLCYSFAILGLLFAGRPVVAEETIKLAYTDPFSGPFASGGDEFLKVFQFIIARKNAAGGALGRKFELVPFDDKLQPAEALIALKSMTDQNIPFVMHCTGSNVGSALIDAVSKHNARNPDNRILYLNCGALATELTNEQCDFWHFRFAGSVDMRAAARIKSLPADLKKVYLLNQDYLFGQSIQHDTKKWLAKLRPDIEIVGDELMPFGKVQDFAPYVAKIKASGAQSVVTGNYNRDLNLLIKAANDAGLDVRFDTFLSHLIGGPTAIGAAGENRLTSVMEFNGNVAVDLKSPEAEKIADRLARQPRDRFLGAQLPHHDRHADRRDQQGRLDRSAQGRAGARGHACQGPGRPGKHHAQGRPPIADALLCRRLQQGREIRFRAYRLRLEDLHDRDRRRPDPADHLQDEAAGMTGQR